MPRMREKDGKRQSLELRIAEKLRLAEVDDVDDDVVLFRLHLVCARRDGQRELFLAR